MQWKNFAAPLALGILLCAGCDRALDNKQKEAADVGSGYKSESAGAATADSASAAVADNEDFAPNAPAPGQSGNKQQTPVPPAPNPDWDRKIVKTAELSLEVKNFKHFADRLHNYVRQYGGYIAQEQQTGSSGEVENTVTIKVPVDRFDDLMT